MEDVYYERQSSIPGSCNDDDEQKADGVVYKPQVQQVKPKAILPKTKSLSTKERMRILSLKLQKLNRGVDVDKARVQTALESQVVDLSQRVESVDNQLRTLHDAHDRKLETLQDALEQERLTRELAEERKVKETILLEKQVHLQVQRSHKELHTVIQNLKTQIHEQATMLERERTARQDAEQRFGVELADRVARISEDLEVEKQARFDGASMLSKTTTRVQSLSDTCERLKQEQNDLRETTVASTKELLTKARQLVDDEKQEREQTEETLLRLIEQTCNQVEALMS